ncbi:hypothetical protein FH972_011372 [Carpinus fangiana]|uniref:Uncharacterized protein n=1 Tax=Carpinus fangiana TaxID=176857 RepID=A0A660KSY8_9ROSI|nr:hypothetical protein FH972_011372 [Carpinus fangiana]
MHCRHCGRDTVRFVIVPYLFPEFGSSLRAAGQGGHSDYAEVRDCEIAGAGSAIQGDNLQSLDSPSRPHSRSHTSTVTRLTTHSTTLTPHEPPGIFLKKIFGI